MALWLLLVACGGRHGVYTTPGPIAGAAIVPGCPSEPDGEVSPCQWRRAVWAHHLWATGRVRALIPSGNAVANRYVEAEALTAALQALGVPATAILPEPMALHTDENIAYSMTIAANAGFVTVAVATDPGQAEGGCAMVNAWSRHTIPCVAARMDLTYVAARMAAGLPVVRTEAVPEPAWWPLPEREARIAQATGQKARQSSFVVYVRQTLLNLFGTSKPPAPPP